MSTELSRAIQSLAIDFLKLLVQFAIPLSIIAGLIGLGWIWASATNPERTQQLVDRWKPIAFKGVMLLGIILLVVTTTRILGTVSAISNARIRAKLSETSDARTAQDIGPVFQSGPSVSYREEKSYTRTLRLPNDIFDQIGQYGASVLAPYLGDPGAENVKELNDVFTRSGNELFVTRTVTRLDEVLVPVEKARVKITADQLAGSQPASRAYEFKFDGSYTFQNTFSTSKIMRFVFPQPYQRGALSNFALKVNGTTVTEPDENGWLVWEGEVQPNQELTANVNYTTQGSRNVNYDFASERRTIKDFELSFISNMPLKVTDGASIPYQTKGNERRWNLQNVLTASNLGISFFATDGSGYTLAKILGFAPIALVLVAIGLFIQRAKELDIALAVATIGAQYFTIAALAPYVEVLLATTIGILLALLLLGFRLKQQVVPTALLVALLPAAFLTKTHAGLAVSIIAIIGLMWLITSSRSRKQLITPE
ncbi:MAG: hypothetical protein KF824_12245 [Fimbriimonadaceae bacterium]|nr:MAG: hypothetical protein KF824_12245 [Fimbriimonadaceae bacterium]